MKFKGILQIREVSIQQEHKSQVRSQVSRRSASLTAVGALHDAIIRAYTSRNHDDLVLQGVEDRHYHKISNILVAS